MRIRRSAPIASVFQISCKPLSFTLKDSCRYWQTINALSYLKTVSTTLNISIYMYTSFYHSSGLTFNGSIYHVLYLQNTAFFNSTAEVRAKLLTKVRLLMSLNDSTTQFPLPLSRAKYLSRIAYLQLK